MTINDMIEQGIEFQGDLKVKTWDEKQEKYFNVSYLNGSIMNGKREGKSHNSEILYIWAKDGVINVEIKEEEE